MTAFNSKRKNEKLAVVVRVPQTTQALLMSRFCFAEDSKIMYKYSFMARVQRVRYLLRRGLVKGAASRLNGLKSLSKLFNFVVCNLSQSSPSLAILVPLWFIISLVFSYLYEVLFSDFLQFQGNFVDGQNYS